MGRPRRDSGYQNVNDSGAQRIHMKRLGRSRPDYRGRAGAHAEQIGDDLSLFIAAVGIRA